MQAAVVTSETQRASLQARCEELASLRSASDGALEAMRREADGLRARLREAESERRAELGGEVAAKEAVRAELRSAQVRAKDAERRAERAEALLEEKDRQMSASAAESERERREGVRVAALRAAELAEKGVEESMLEARREEAQRRSRLEALLEEERRLRAAAEARAEVAEAASEEGLGDSGRRRLASEMREELREAQGLVTELAREKRGLAEALREEKKRRAALEQRAGRDAAADGGAAALSPAKLSGLQGKLRELAGTLSEERRVFRALEREHEDLLTLLAQQELEKASLKDSLLAVGGRRAVDSAMHTAASTAVRRFGMFVDVSGATESPLTPGSGFAPASARRGAAGPEVTKRRAAAVGGSRLFTPSPVKRR